MSTRTALSVEGSSLVNVPCLTSLEPVDPELEVEMVLGAGLANGARPILDLGVCFGLGGDFCLVICRNWVDLVPLGDPGDFFVMFFGLGAITGLGGTCGGVFLGL